jgi:probable DNA repair protein
MTSGAEFPRISKPELLGRLAEGHAVSTSVVTPNLRLAAALRRDFDAQQIAQGLTAWEAADVLPLPAFVERLYEDALYSKLALPILLTSAQEQTLWEDIVRGSEAGAALLSAPPAAALAREAWQLAHAWRLMPRLKGYPANDDARAFADWAWRYEGITQRDRHCDRARLADIVAPHLAHAALRKPATLVAYGFDILNAQQRELFAALAKAGVAVVACGPQEYDGRAAAACRAAFTSAKEEIRAAARWARSRLEADSNARIGIVVPDLAQSRNAVQRIFAQVMEPAHLLPGRERRPLPFNISLGEPLSSYPLVAAALRLLEVARAEVGFEHASRLIRSPFITGAGAELAQRARLDAELRKVAAPMIGLERLRRAIAKLTASDNRYGVPACTILSQRLAALSKFAREHLHGAKRPGEWAKAMSALLDAAGFPGERTLDSVEYQTLKKFHEAIAGFAALERVAGRMRFDDACARLARITAETLYQPEAPEVPIQVLGVLESAGLEFDHLWVMGLTDEAWPIPARPNPFIPVALQRLAGVPESSAAASLELDSRITRGWLAAAGEVVLSHPLREADRELVPSPLIRDLQESKAEDLALPEYESMREAIRRARRGERTPDAKGPALGAAGPALGAAAPAVNAPGVISGGTSVFKDQAACPFRAFALHRLGAEGLEAPPAGLDARERGTLLHAMLAHVWQELKSKSRLDAASDADLVALLALAADHAIGRLRARRPDAIEGRFMELEKTRLAKLGRAWLDIERARPPFEVAAVEQKRPVSFGGVTVNAKLDRMDSLIADEQGQWLGRSRAILDYKTGSANVGDWLGVRPDDPQLPLYAVSQNETAAEDVPASSYEGDGGVCAVAFARLKAGDMGFRGISRDEGLIPGVATLDKQRSKAAKDYGSWEELLAGWRRELEALGAEFAAGEARVDPKRGDETCRYCDLKPLCRINERAFSIGIQDEGAGE